MAIPFFKEMRIGGYLLKQKLLGRKRYPLVLMLEPLFRCNLACVGCGKIDYPDAILNRRMSAQECWDAAEECGAPMVAIPGGEPLIHKEIGEIVRGLVERKKLVELLDRRDRGLAHAHGADRLTFDEFDLVESAEQLAEQRRGHPARRTAANNENFAH